MDVQRKEHRPLVSPQTPLLDGWRRYHSESLKQRVGRATRGEDTRESERDKERERGRACETREDVELYGREGV